MGARVDLDLTLYASFSLPMFRKKGECWVKVYGFGKGTRLCSNGGLKCYGSLCSGELLEYAAGHWISREVCLGELEARAREVAEELMRGFYCLGVSASPWDALAVLASAFLSRNTDYHRNTVRWVRAFLGKLEALGGCERAAAKAALSTYREFGSYQLRQFVEVVDSLLAIARTMPLPPGSASSSALRRRLLEVKYLGPKVADSFILHSGLDRSRAPVDIHYLRYLKRRGLLEGEYVYPQKVYCARYECTACPISRKCVYSHTSRLFRDLNGFVQTAAYVAGKLGVKSCEDLSDESIRAKIREATVL